MSAVGLAPGPEAVKAQPHTTISKIPTTSAILGTGTGLHSGRWVRISIPHLELFVAEVGDDLEEFSQRGDVAVDAGESRRSRSG
jgi:hypothetical protein